LKHQREVWNSHSVSITEAALENRTLQMDLSLINHRLQGWFW